MLGRFLEFSIATPDIRASRDFYLELGFSEAEVGEAWSHPYAVLTDGRLYLGLHQHELHATSTTCLTFVKPGLLEHLDRLEALGVQVEYRRLGNDVFNEVGWLTPSGQLVRLVEARTFSPVKRIVGDPSLCGYFLEIALPAPDLLEAQQFWERLGFVGLTDPTDPQYIPCTSDSVDIGLYAASLLRGPALRFEVEDMHATLARLTAVGIRPPGQGAVLRAPEGTPILLTVAS